MTNRGLLVNNRIAAIIVAIIAIGAVGGYLYFTYLRNVDLTINKIGEGSVTANPVGPYSLGAQVSLNAVPSEGWVFSTWGGDASGKDPTITIRLDSDKAVTATFTKKPKYEIVVQVSGSGNVEFDKVGPYYNGTVVQIKAVPITGWEFIGWGGAVSGSDISMSLVVNANKTISAEFRKIVYIKIDVSLSGSGNVEFDKIGPYVKDTMVTITAVPASGYEFLGWSGGITSVVNPLTLKADANKTIMATFGKIILYTLDLEIFGQGNVVLNQTGPYRQGTVVSAQAIPASGWSFREWGGAESGFINPARIGMISNATLTATFVENVILNLMTEGEGTISSNGTGRFFVGQMLKLTAIPAKNWAFKGWKELNYDGTNPLTLKVKANSTLTAVFTPLYYVNIQIVGSGNVISSFNGPYAPDARVSFNAVPNSGWQFLSWSGAASGSQNPIVVQINENKTITATFTRLDYRILVYSDEPDDLGNYTHDNQPPVKALTNLGLGYVYGVFHDDFLNKLKNDGPWDLVIYKEEFQPGTQEVYDALSSYADTGRLIVSTYCIGRYSNNSLWDKLGASFVSNATFETRNIYIWDSGHQTVKSPNIIKSPISLINVQYLSDALNFIDPVPGSTIIIGNSATPQNGKGLIVVNESGRGVFNGVLPSTMGQDQNSDGKTDGTALYENLIRYVLGH